MPAVLRWRRRSSISLPTRKRRGLFQRVRSRGSVHPEVLAVMQEVGIDLSDAKPQKLTEELAKDAQLLITMGCGDKCPYVPGLRRDDWPLQDPKGLPLTEVRSIRDEIQQKVKDLLAEEHLNRQ